MRRHVEKKLRPCPQRIKATVSANSEYLGVKDGNGGERIWKIPQFITWVFIPTLICQNKVAKNKTVRKQKENQTPYTMRW